MKKKLHVLLLLITLVHQTTSPFSWEWCSNLFTRATSSITQLFSRFSQDQVSQLKGAGKMLGLAGIVGGVYYLHSYFSERETYLKKKQCLVSPELEGIVEYGVYTNQSDGGDINIQRIKVAQQIGASCGYHSVKNIFGYLKKYFISEDPLNDPTLVETLIGRNGFWRRRVIIQEINASLKNSIKEQFEFKEVSRDIGISSNSLEVNWNPVSIRSRYQKLLPEFIAYLIQNPVEIIEGKGFQSSFGDFIAYRKSIQIDDGSKYLIFPHHDVTKDDIVTMLSEHLSNQETIEKYIRFKPESLRIEGSGEEVILTVNGKTERLGKKAGDWIRDDHMLTICNEINNELEEKVPVIIISDIEDLYRPRKSAVPGEIATFVHLARASEKYIQSFIVGTMSQRRQSSGHWFSVIFEKNENKHVYTIMDSLNRDRVDSPLIQKLVYNVEAKFLELKKDS